MGAAVATPGFGLPARWVIHTVGPNRHAGQTNPALLASCFTESLRIAEGLGSGRWPFPRLVRGSMAGTPARWRRWRSTPSDRVCGAALRKAETCVELVEFVLFGPETVAVFR